MLALVREGAQMEGFLGRLHGKLGWAVILFEVAVIVGAVVLIFFSDLVSLLTEATSFDWANYVFIIPFVVGYAVFSKRKVLRTVLALRDNSKVPVFVGVGLCLSAFFLYFYGTYTLFALFTHLVAMCLFVIGCVLILFGGRVFRVLVFPLGYMFFISPPPLEVFYAVGADLAGITASTVYYIVSGFGFQVQLIDKTFNFVSVGGQQIALTIDVGCSGIYSLVGFATFCVFVVYILKGTLWRRLLLFPIGGVVIYLLNILRICLIVFLGYLYGEAVAFDVFHLLGGVVLIFIGTIVVLIIAEKALKINVRYAGRLGGVGGCISCGKGLRVNGVFCLSCGRQVGIPVLRFPARDVVFRVLAVLLISAVFAVSVVPIVVLGNNQVAVSIYSYQGQQTAQIFPNTSEWNLDNRYIYRDTGYEQMVHEDAVFWYRYFSTSQQINVMTLLEVSSSTYCHGVSGWTICMPPAGYKISAYEPVVLQQSPPIIAWFIVLGLPGNDASTMAVLAWTQKMYLSVNSIFQQKLIGVSLVAYPIQFKVAGVIGSVSDYGRIKAELTRIAEAIIAHWSPAVNNSILGRMSAYLISDWPTVAALAAAVCVVGGGFWALDSDQRERRRRKVADSLPSREKNVLSAIIRLGRTSRVVSGGAVHGWLRAERGYGSEFNLEEETLMGDLLKLESEGLVRRDYRMRGDSVYLYWRSNLD